MLPYQSSAFAGLSDIPMLPRKDLNLDYRVQSAACCHLHHEALSREDQI